MKLGSASAFAHSIGRTGIKLQQKATKVTENFFSVFFGWLLFKINSDFWAGLSKEGSGN
jgi:hypothetical protein